MESGQKKLYKCMYLVPGPSAHPATNSGQHIDTRDVRDSRINQVDVDVGPGATLVLPSTAPGAAAAAVAAAAAAAATRTSTAYPLVEEVQGQEEPQEGSASRKGSKEGASQSRTPTAAQERRSGHRASLQTHRDHLVGHEHRPAGAVRVPQSARQHQDRSGTVHSLPSRVASGGRGPRARQELSRRDQAVRERQAVRGPGAYERERGPGRRATAAFSRRLAAAGATPNAITPASSTSGRARQLLRDLERNRLQEIVNRRLSTLTGQNKKQRGKKGTSPPVVNPTIYLDTDRRIVHELRDLHRHALEQQAARKYTGYAPNDSADTSAATDHSRTVSQVLAEPPPAESSPVLPLQHQPQPPPEHQADVSTAQPPPPVRPAAVHQEPNPPPSNLTQHRFRPLPSATPPPAFPHRTPSRPVASKRRTASAPVAAAERKRSRGGPAQESSSYPPPAPPSRPSVQTYAEQTEEQPEHSSAPNSEQAPSSHQPVPSQRGVRRPYDTYQDHDDEYAPPARLRARYDDGRPLPMTQRTVHKRTFTEVGGPAWDWEQRLEDPALAAPDPYRASKRARYAWAEDDEDDDDEEDEDEDHDNLVEYGPFAQPPSSPARRVAGVKRRAETLADSDEEKYLWSLPVRAKRRLVTRPKKLPVRRRPWPRRPPVRMPSPQPASNPRKRHALPDPPSEDELYPQYLPPPAKRSMRSKKKKKKTPVRKKIPVRMPSPQLASNPRKRRALPDPPSEDELYPQYLPPPAKRSMQSKKKKKKRR